MKAPAIDPTHANGLWVPEGHVMPFYVKAAVIVASVLLVALIVELIWITLTTKTKQE